MILTIANQKGGVGKTTYAFNIVKLALLNSKKVLAIDLDTQGNLSQLLSQDFTINQKAGGAETLFTTPAPTVISDNLHLLHGHKHLENIDNVEYLKQAMTMNFTSFFSQYDLVVIDTPPSIGPRQVMPFFWSDKVVIPLESSDLSLTGLVSINHTLNQVKVKNKNLQRQFVVNRFIKTQYQQGILDKLQQRVDISAVLPNSTVFAESMSANKGVFEFAKTKKALKDHSKQVFSLYI